MKNFATSRIRTQSSERGLSLLSVLVSLAFMLTISFFAYFHQIHRLELRSVFLSARRASVAAESGALEDFLRMAAKGHALLDCRTFQESRGKASITRTLCGRNSQNIRMQHGSMVDGQMLRRGLHFPQLQFTELFTGPDTCHYRRSTSSTRTYAGLLLSAPAALSKFDCRELPSGAYHAGNLSAPAHWSAPSRNLLAVRGYAEFPYGIEVADELLLVAGGDIFIAAVNASASSAHLTLVSTTGTIQVQSASPALSIQTISWLGASLPPGTKLGTGRLQPPSLNFEMLGFERSF